VTSDLSVEVGGLELRGPVLAASGTFGYGTEVPLLERRALGAMVSKGIFLKPRAGTAPPRIAETPSGMLNAIGLQGPGVDGLIRDYAPKWAAWDFPVLVNINGESASEYGELAALIQDWGNVVENPRNGLFGALIVGPKGATYRDPITGEDISLKSSWRADVVVDRSLPENEHRQNYRDFTLLFQDEDNQLGVSFMPYIQQNAGITAVNYRSEPTAYRIEKGCTVAEVFSCVKAGAVPATPMLMAHVGDPVAIHVLGAFSEQVQLFTVDGHEWPHEPYMKGADLVSTMEFGGSEVINAYLHGGAGGPNKVVGDYLWQNQRPAYMNAGHWGLLKVLPAGDRQIQPLAPQTPETRTADAESPAEATLTSDPAR